MRVDPLVRRRHVPVGLVISPRRVLGEWGTGTLAEAPPGAKLYCPSKRTLARYVRGGRGRMLIWRERVVTFEVDGRRVTNLRGALGDAEPDEAYEALAEWARWVRAHGAHPGTLAGTAWSLWRSTLTAPYVRWGWEPPVDGGVSYGGRQGERPGVYENVDLWDLSAAYAWALGTLRVPTRLVEREVLTDEIPEGYGWARAAVAVPDLPWAPLPLALGRGSIAWPARTELEGIWTLDELRVAQRAGCEVVLTRTWCSSSHREPFRRWYEHVVEGRRELSTRAAALLKAAANTLWARFLSVGEGAWWSWPDGPQGDPLIEPDPRPRRRALSPALAGLVASRIRARVYAEALAPYPDAILVHTDGVALPAGRHPQPNTGGPGRWRLADHADRITVLSAQAFCYERDGRRIYRISGVPPALRAQAWRHMVARLERPDRSWRPRPSEADPEEWTRSWMALLRTGG